MMANGEFLAAIPQMTIGKINESNVSAVTTVSIFQKHEWVEHATECKHKLICACFTQQRTTALLGLLFLWSQR